MLKQEKEVNFGKPKFVIISSFGKPKLITPAAIIIKFKNTMVKWHHYVENSALFRYILKNTKTLYSQ